MSEADEDLLAPSPLGPELASGKWRVRVIDGDAKIIEEKISGKEVWSMINRRVMVDFNRRGKPIKDSGGLFGSWLGSLSNDLNMLPINYTDWRKVPNYRKEMAWKVIQKKFWFDDPRRRKKYVLSSLGARCRDLKQRLWKMHRRNTLEEAFEARPGLIPVDQWKEFVEMQFSDKAKKMRERNIKSRSKFKIPHALGKKSLARKANEMEEKTGREPSRSELFLASRTRLDGSLVCKEARISVDKLKEGETSNDSISSLYSAPNNMEIFEIKSDMKRLEEKVDIVASAVEVLIKSKDFHFQESKNGEHINLASALALLLQENENGGNIKLASALALLLQQSNINLHQASSSISSDKDSINTKSAI